VDTIGVKLELITAGVESPIEFNVASDGSRRVFITDTRGKIWILDKDSLLSKPFFNIYDKLGQQDPATGAGAISGVAFHPKYSSNGKFYVCYNAPSTIKENPCTLVVSEFKADKANRDLADLGSEQRVLEVEGKNINANGSQIAFGPDGFLYISIGDDAIGDSNYVYKAQDLKYLNGKILRIDIDQSPYANPPDNPFVDVKGAKPEIWAYGFRKMWRFGFEPGTGLLFGADVGELMQEEIDIVSKGRNYGWPHKEGDSIFIATASKANTEYTPPIISYARQVGICVIGGIFYTGSGLPRIKGRYLFADFNGKLFALAKTEAGSWGMQPVKIIDHPEGAFLICGFGVDEKNEPVVMGFLNTKEGQKGVVYRILEV
jgi:glucose/arabinose dehydrogenase